MVVRMFKWWHKAMCLAAATIFVVLPVAAKIIQETGSVVIGGLVGFVSCILLFALILLMLDNTEWSK